MPKANTSLTKLIEKRLNGSRLFYVCRNLERAVALGKIKGCFIITNYCPSSAILAKGLPNVIFIKGKTILDTRDLLNHPRVKTTIRHNDYIIVFKNTHELTKICLDNNWRLLNPPAALSNTVEEKISQVEWLGNLGKFLPPHRILKCGTIKWQGKKFILQFNRAHTGAGTFLIVNKTQLAELQTKFPERPARVTKYINGPFFTNNNVVWNNAVLTGNISYQITGLKPFTDNPFATIGNDWALPGKILTATQTKQFLRIATAVGQKLAKSGWRGLFGIDAALDTKTGKIFLIEINCRQPASASWESELQKNKTGIDTFTAHLAALLGIKNNNYKLIKINDGAQIILRNQIGQAKIDTQSPKFKQGLSAFFRQTGYKIINYKNDKPGSDLIRFQIRDAIMSKDNELNKHGHLIVDFTHSLKHGNIWNSKRAGILVIKTDRLLVMVRNKFGNKYMIIPAGSKEPGETIENTAVRETKEETGLTVTIDKTKPPIYLRLPRQEYYFFPKTITGKVKLGGPEEQYNNKDDSYQLAWINLKNLPKTNLKPEALKNILIKQYLR
ncbi:MAG: NUDIX domain-containing protein [bacterium]|nr:NUDIX domain-containing protein [bacterium]